MNSESPENEAPPADLPATPAPSPGAMIAEARERAQMSIDALSVQTRLTRQTLEAMERDDYGALLEPVYVRGYYRKCAKVLDMDEERLIAAYSARAGKQAVQAPAKLRLASGTELGTSSRLPLSMAVLVAIVAIVVTAFFWLSRSKTPQYATVTVPTSDGTAPATAAPAASVPAESVMAQPAEDTAAAQDSSNASPGDAPAQAPVTVLATGNTAADEPPAESVAVAPAPDGALQLRFVKKSWVRVDDAGGHTLLNAMRDAGSSENLTGKLPLSVFLGYAPGVIAEFDGQTIDLSPYVRGNNTARFSVPQE